MDRATPTQDFQYKRAQVTVAPRDIGLINKCLQQARRVALHSIDPIYADYSAVIRGADIPEVPGSERIGLDMDGASRAERQVIEALNLSLEGPPGHLSYVFRLLAKAGLGSAFKKE